jgi:hypothetical protein
MKAEERAPSARACGGCWDCKVEVYDISCFRSLHRLLWSLAVRTKPRSLDTNVHTITGRVDRGVLFAVLSAHHRQYPLLHFSVVPQEKFFLEISGSGFVILLLISERSV